MLVPPKVQRAYQSRRRCLALIEHTFQPVMHKRNHLRSKEVGVGQPGAIAADSTDMRTQLLTYASSPMRRSSPTVLAVALVALISSCTKTNPVLECDKTGVCSDPRFPFCDATGDVAGDPGKCIAVACTPATFAACDGDNELVCDAAGTNYTSMHCENGCSAAEGGCIPCLPNMQACGGNTLYSCDASGSATPLMCDAGCVDSPTPHCAELDPRYLPGACDQPGQGTLHVDADRILDTSVDTNCTGLVHQSSGPDICLVRYDSAVITAGATLHVTNTSQAGSKDNVKNRPLAIVVDHDLVIDGVIDAAAKGSISGPGGGYVLAGDNTQGAIQGFGGAGSGTPGGNGGTFQADGGAQNAGPQLGNPLGLASFVGGSANFGGGGGGLLLVSCRGAVNISGIVNVGGGGGLSGDPANVFACGSGTGGGAGGNVSIEAVDIAVTGSLFANGGGGGAGCVSSNANAGANGDDAPLSDVMPARGGVAVTGGGSGGKGGIGTSPPGDGRAAIMSAGGYPGGGGGSVGWLLTSTPGATPSLTPAHVSPPLQPNAISTVK